MNALIIVALYIKEHDGGDIGCQLCENWAPPGLLPQTERHTGSGGSWIQYYSTEVRHPSIPESATHWAQD